MTQHPMWLSTVLLAVHASGVSLGLSGDVVRPMSGDVVGDVSGHVSGLVGDVGNNSESFLIAGLGICDEVKKVKVSDDSSQAKQRVMLSVPVFEEMWYLKDLVRNLLTFTETSTTIILHLNKNSTYSPAQLQEISSFSPRVLVTPKRVFVHSFHGSLFYSHVLNIEYGLDSLKENVGYVVTMASNSRLLRSGMESYIRENHASLGHGIEEFYTGVEEIPKQIHDAYNNRWAYNAVNKWWPLSTVLGLRRNDFILKKANLYQLKPEGAFFPASVISQLVKALRSTKGTLTSTLQINSFLEEFVFVTFAMKAMRCGVVVNPSLSQQSSENFPELSETSRIHLETVGDFSESSGILLETAGDFSESSKNISETSGFTEILSYSSTCKGTGHNIVKVLTTSTISPEATPSPDDIRQHVLKDTTFFGVKAVTRTKGDSKGTKNFIHSLEKDELRKRCANSS
ncbi:hypothetical protein AAMO2058_000402300 [Amorphochlora amoebiformis]